MRICAAGFDFYPHAFSGVSFCRAGALFKQKQSVCAVPQRFFFCTAFNLYRDDYRDAAHLLCVYSVQQRGCRRSPDGYGSALGDAFYGGVSAQEILCGAAAVIGVFLIVTGGSLKSLNVSMMGLIMGLGSGLTGALYVILPQKLIKQVGSGTATSWALLLTGVAVTLFNHFWNESLNWSLGAVLAYAFIVIFGTIAAFWLFQAAAELIPSDVAGMMETLDPVSATVLGVLFLGLTVNIWELIGGVLILATVVVLAIPSKHPSLYKYKRGNGS